MSGKLAAEAEAEFHHLWCAPKSTTRAALSPWPRHRLHHCRALGLCLPIIIDSTALAPCQRLVQAGSMLQRSLGLKFTSPLVHLHSLGMAPPVVQRRWCLRAFSGERGSLRRWSRAAISWPSRAS